MEPGDDNDFVTALHSVQPLYVCWKYLKESIGRTLCVKQRGIFSVLNFGSDNSNSLNGKLLHTHHCYFFFLLMSQIMSEWMFRPTLVML